jgi:ketosteroid isomerase-like protein
LAGRDEKGGTMKTLLMIIPLVFVCCFTFGCQQQGEEVASVDVEADIQAIKDSVTGIEAADNADDLDSYISYQADDIVRIPPNEPAAIGKEAVRIAAQQLFDEYTLQGTDVVEKVEISGGLAVAYIPFSVTATPKEGGEPLEINGNKIYVFKKQSDGLWKRIYAMWSNESLILPNQAE